jgi:hypothetical protein
MSIFKTQAVKDLDEAAKAIPVIDFGPAFRGEPAAGRLSPARCGTRASTSASSISPDTVCRRR